MHFQTHVKPVNSSTLLQGRAQTWSSNTQRDTEALAQEDQVEGEGHAEGSEDVEERKQKNPAGGILFLEETS